MSETILGFDRNSQDGKKEVGILLSSRPLGAYCIGSNGQGKSVLMGNCILSDIYAGMGACVLDAHADLVHDLLVRIPLKRMQDVIYLNLLSDCQFGLNIFECSDPSDSQEVALTASFVMHLFNRLWGVDESTPRLAQVLRNLSVACIENGLTLVEAPLVLQDSSFRASLKIENEEVRAFFQTYNNLRPHDQIEWTQSTLNKIDGFLIHPLVRRIFGQRKSTISMIDIMDSSKILLCVLDPRLEDLTTLVGTAIIGKIVEAAYSRMTTAKDERKLFPLYVDEMHRYQTPDLALLYTEGRKASVCLFGSHQTRRQLSIQMQAATLQAENKIMFCISAEDRDLANVFNAEVTQEVTRREEILVPRKSVIQHLMISGHPSKVVMDFTREYIIPFTQATKEKMIPYEYESGWATVSGEYYPSSPVSGVLSHFVPEEVAQGLTYLNEFFYLSMARADIATIQTFYVKSCKCFRQYLGFVGYGNHELGGTTDYGRSEKWRSSPRRAEELHRFQAFNTALQAAVRELEHSPIMEGSGNYENIVGRNQTVADKLNEIGNKLATLPRYTAMVKLGTREYTIQTIPLPPVRAGVTLEDRLQSVREANIQDGYIRPGNDIAHEIRERIDSLKPKLTPKQTL